MKILVVTQYFYPETFRVNALCRELVRRGHRVKVLTAYPQYPQGKIYPGYGFNLPYERRWEGVEVERLRVPPRGSSRLGLLRNCGVFVLEAGRWVRRCRERFDAVYVFEVSPVTVGLPAVAYGKKFGVPVLFNVQDLWPENVEVVLGVKNPLVLGVINRIVDRIYRGSSRILCASRGFVENIAARGVPREKLVYWPQFCEEPRLEGAVRPEIYPEDTFNIVFAGNFGAAQGLDLLLKTAERLRDEPVRWFLVGDGRRGEHLRRETARAGLDDRVTFTGRVSEQEANRYVRFAQGAFISFLDNPVFNMTVPAKLQTYLACGTPVLAAAGGECAQIVRSADCGVVTEKTPEALEQGVRELMARSEEERRAMGQRGREYFHRNFSMKLLVDRLEEELYALCPRVPPGEES